MITDLLGTFEQLVVARNPLLAKKLKPGLSEEQIRRLLRRHRVDGDLAQVVALYRWKNGTKLDPEIVASKVGFFPGKAYYFLDLEMALGHLDHTKVAARKRPQLADGAFYFPLFWDGSTGWIATDIRPSHHNAVIAAEHRAEVPFREAYASLYEFLEDAIRALTTNEGMRPNSGTLT